MYTMSREIGIDAGHRVPTHGSKCRHLHGHRYTIQAICRSEALQDTGEQTAMVLDFGFLKEEMMANIDLDCDHGLILYAGDELVEQFINDDYLYHAIDIMKRVGFVNIPAEYASVGKMYLIPDIPTAEVLAKHWFYRLQGRVSERSSRLATLVAVKVWETPNCWAVYSKEGEFDGAR